MRESDQGPSLTQLLSLDFFWTDKATAKDTIYDLKLASYSSLRIHNLLKWE
jgi:hypothetical protein